MKVIGIIVIIFLFNLTSCLDETKIEGVYVAKNQANITDSVSLQKGIYVQKIYRKIDNSLVFEHSDKWRYNGGTIVFENFYPEEDDVIPSHAKNFERFLMGTEFDLKKEKGNFRIYHRVNKTDSFLEKVR